MGCGNKFYAVMKFKYGIGTDQPQPPITWRWVVHDGPPREEDRAVYERLRRLLADENGMTDSPKSADGGELR
jgi:hypothetical protein